MSKSLGDKIKSWFSKSAQEEAGISLEKKEQLNAKYNHPDDYFVNDEFIDEDELLLRSEKKRKRKNFRTGYYVVGFGLALAMIIYSVFGMVSDSQYDIKLLIQDDGSITSSQVEYIKNYIAQVAQDENGDGKVLVDADYVSFPKEITDKNAGEYESAQDAIRKVLVSYKICICIGRENFLNEVSNVRNLRQDYVLLPSLNGFEAEENSTLNEYCIAVRTTENKNDKYSPKAKELFDEIIK